MKFTLALLATVGLVAAAPQGVTSILPASGTAPAGCQPTYTGNFEITIVKPSNLKRDLKERQATTCGQTGILTLNLANGQLHDNDGRTGYIAGENEQFQFDKPIQAGASITSGFSVCQNGSIALGGTTTFFQCQSGGFYNLYYKNIAPQCEPVNIDIIPCAGSSAAPASGAPASGSAVPVSVSSDGQPQATAMPTGVPVSVYTDGQPQATAAATSVAAIPVSEFTDGQPQATANATVKAAPAPTSIQQAGAAKVGFGGALAAVAAVAAALL